ncbi:MAG TPA: hypothetical protein VGE63_00765 [Candidatus Paceibacterota bacterium]
MEQSSQKTTTTIVVIALVIIIGLIIVLSQRTVKAPEPTTPEQPTTPVTQTPVTPATAVYADTQYGYEVTYPTNFTLNTSKNIINDGYIAEGKPLVSSWVLDFPNDTYKGTNLTRVHMGVGVFEADEKSCVNMVTGNPLTAFPSKQTPVTINGQKFTKVTGIGDAGAGQFETTEYYATYKNNKCYRMILLGHGFNDIVGHNQDNPSDQVKQYDIAPLDAIFTTFAESFKFTN